MKKPKYGYVLNCSAIASCRHHHHDHCTVANLQSTPDDLGGELTWLIAIRDLIPSFPWKNMGKDGKKMGNRWGQDGKKMGKRVGTYGERYD
jgi:hypothetical protein